MIKDYYDLAKPGLVYGNIIPLVAGFALGAQWRFNVPLLLFTVAGLALVMGSGCVFNNYIDRDLDTRMERTRGRALAARRISGRAALLYGVALGLGGFLVLGVFTTALALALAAAGFFFYVFVYSLWAKRRTVYAAEVGSIAGAMPPVVGYAAAANHLDAGAFLLFIILVLWQMPHFYAISIRRFGEYTAAGVPTLSVRKGIRPTKVRMLMYIIAFTLAAPLLAVVGYLDYGYFTVAAVLGLAWLLSCIFGFRTIGAATDALWARRMFLFSLFVMAALFISIVLRV